MHPGWDRGIDGNGRELRRGVSIYSYALGAYPSLPKGGIGLSIGKPSRQGGNLGAFESKGRTASTLWRCWKTQSVNRSCFVRVGTDRNGVEVPKHPSRVWCAERVVSERLRITRAYSRLRRVWRLVSHAASVHEREEWTVGDTGGATLRQKRKRAKGCPLVGAKSTDRM